MRCVRSVARPRLARHGEAAPCMAWDSHMSGTTNPNRSGIRAVCQAYYCERATSGSSFCHDFLFTSYGDEILSTQLLASAQNSSLPGQLVQRFICGFVAVTEACEHVLAYSLTV
jgi:hypothetical protein